MPSVASIYGTFAASVKCVGTACTLAAVGYYLHRRGFVVGEGKRTLAIISQQVTFPLFLATKIIFCNQDWSDKPCPDVTKSLSDVWLLFWWPVVVVGSGLLIGYIVARTCGTPHHQVRAVLAACGFGNTTGLPITLLTVVHSNFPETSDLGRIDPTLFLSVYLLLYPVLQWGIGGWLLAPEEDESDDEDEYGVLNGSATQMIDQNVSIMTKQSSSTSAHRRLHAHKTSIGETTLDSMKHNVLNNQELADIYISQRHGLTSNDEGMYMSEYDLADLARRARDRNGHPESHDHADDTLNNRLSAFASMDTNTGMPLEEGDEEEEETALLKTTPHPPNYEGVMPSPPPLSPPPPLPLPIHTSPSQYDVETIFEALRNIMRRCLQPPVVGAIIGIFIASIAPLRGVFVDLENRSSNAPLQWLFDGLYNVGLTAVPINMMILGCNLSGSQMTFSKARDMDGVTDVLLPPRTMIGIVIGKMVVQPIFGILLCLFLKMYILHIPEDIDGSFYLVLMIVFLTPTANNVMVMVELSGSGAKEGIAAVIALQYVVAPIILSLTMTVAVGIASDWS